MPLFVTIVLDGVGIGEQPDAGLYNDTGSDTLGHVCAAMKPSLPNLEKMGLGCIESLTGIRAVGNPLASFGKMTEVSAGKDSTTGHWELSGIHLENPFPTFPDGFPDDMVRDFLEATGYAGILGNCAASGTAIIDAEGAKHQETGYPIVYTSADSVFQVAAHKDTIALDELYRICAIARDKICIGPNGVGRVIARPFVGAPGSYQRVSAERKDFSLKPPAPPIQELLQQAGIRTCSVGKIYDLFGGVGFDESHKTKSNLEGIHKTLDLIKQADAGENAFIWTNLVDFDQEYGHRNDPAGFAKSLEEFDQWLPEFIAQLPDDGVLILTADHGNDPTTPSTDHSREYVPVLKYQKGKPAKDLGTRATFADHAHTVASYFEVNLPGKGEAF